MLSGILRSITIESRSACTSGAVRFIFQRGCSSESGIVSSAFSDLGCALGTGLLALPVSSCWGIANAPMLNRHIVI